MTNYRSLLLLLIGAVVMVAAVFVALRFAGDTSDTDEPPATAMSRADVEKIVRNYLLENPEVIIEAVNGMQRKEDAERIAKMREGAKSHATALFKEAEPLVAGNPKGDVTIIEFFDYRCPYCKQVTADLATLLKQDGNIRLVLKEFPILSAESGMAAKAAIASTAQGKYWDFHMALMNAEELSEELIFKLAKDTGIDVARLKKDMADPKINKRLAETDDLAKKLGVNSTPTFFVGDEPMAGAQSLNELKDAVAKARKAQPS